MKKEPSNDESLSWSVRLSDGAPAKAFVVFGFAVTAGFVGAVVYGKPLLGLVGFAIILAATAEFWAGARYSLGPKGASARIGLSLTAIDWSDVRRVIDDGDVVRLSPLAQEGRMDPFRGVTLRFTPENRDRVMGLIRSYIGDDVRLLGEGTGRDGDGAAFG